MYQVLLLKRGRDRRHNRSSPHLAGRSLRRSCGGDRTGAGQALEAVARLPASTQHRFERYLNVHFSER